MRAGEVEAHLLHLNEPAKLSFLDDLIERKLAGPEKSHLSKADVAFHECEYQRLVGELKAAMESSHLPERPAGKTALSDLLVRLRLRERQK